MAGSNIVRRGLTGLVATILFLTACMPLALPEGQTAPQPAGITPTPYLTTTPQPVLPVPTRFYQAPGLENLTQPGILPAVAKRLPEHPKVIRPLESAGKYGGTWRMVIQPAADGAQFIRTVAYEPLVRWTTDWSGIEPNLAETYSVNSSATEYTFTLRKGIRWSDGELFTTTDIRFWYEKILLNGQLTPVVPSWLKSHGQVAIFEFIDSLTFKVKFSSPNGMFLDSLASPDALMITAFPFHYVKKFHPDYMNETELQMALAKGNYFSWVDMFIKLVGVKPVDVGNFADPYRPRLSAWVLDTPYALNVATVTWHRNPYYWKVDTSGKQLPYIDSVFFYVVDNMDEAINRVINGDVDMQNLSEMGLDAAALLADQPNSPYSLNPLTPGSNNVMVINFNLTDTDPVMRSVFQSREFRIGLSYAINRQEIIDVIYHGKAQPWQTAPLQNSPFYDPTLAKQYTEYDVEKANEYLDKAGFVKDTLGKRLRPDGLPISFAIDVLENDSQQIAMLNLVAKYWGAVGVDVQPKPEPLPIFLASVRANMHHAAAYTGGATYVADMLINPANFLPSGEDTFWAIPWVSWYNRVAGYQNEQPDSSVRNSLNLYDRIISMKNRAEQIRMMNSVLVFSRENFWTIGIAAGTEEYGIVRNNFHNVPKNMPSAWMYPDPGPANPEQFYFQ